MARQADRKGTAGMSASRDGDLPHGRLTLHELAAAVKKQIGADTVEVMWINCEQTPAVRIDKDGIVKACVFGDQSDAGRGPSFNGWPEHDGIAAEWVDRISDWFRVTSVDTFGYRGEDIIPFGWPGRAPARRADA